jgi:hypothetical protein
MLMFEQIVRRGYMVFDAERNALVFNRAVLAGFPETRRRKMAEFSWLAGEWSSENRVRATPTTPAYTDTYVYTYRFCDDDSRITVSGPGGKDRPYLTYDPFSERYMMTFTDVIYGVLQASNWSGDSIVFEGPLTSLGADCHLRQTLSKRGDDEFHLLNEERLADGSFVITDEFDCRRK